MSWFESVRVGLSHYESVRVSVNQPTGSVPAACLVHCDVRHQPSLTLFSLQYLSELLFDQPIICTVSAADVQAAFSAIISRIQRL